MHLYYSKKNPLLSVFTKSVDFGRFYLVEDRLRRHRNLEKNLLCFTIKIGVYKNGKVSGSLK